MKLDLANRIIIGDGALGTQLHKLAGKPVLPPESLNLTTEGLAIVRQVHCQYIEAGAEIIETNTFAANVPRLERFSLGDDCARINSAAVETAKQAAAGRVLVAGSIGPLDIGLAEGAEVRRMENYFRIQVEAMAGVDLFMLETFSSPAESRAALSAVSGAGNPIFFSMGGLTIARPYARKAVLEMIALANEYKVAVLGINCLSPYDLGVVLNIVADNTELPLMAYPNAGTPSIERGVVQYNLSAEILVEEARKWRQKGVVVFGGCCGTAPEHIQALSAAFRGQAPDKHGWLARAKPQVAVVSRPAPIVARADPSQNTVRAKMHSRRGPLIAVEIRPVLSRSLQATVEAIEPIVGGGIDFMTVPDNPSANPARDCVACAHLLQERYAVPTIIHKTATQTNALHVSSYLLGAYDLGIRGVLAITGDTPSAGSFDRLATRVTDVRNSIELLRLVGLMRSGLLVNDQSLPYPVDFAAGCAFAHGTKMASQVSWLAKKADAGAEFVFTQPVFSRDDLARVQEALSKFTMKKFIGIMPLLSVRQAELIQSGKIPGMSAPQEVAEELKRYTDHGDLIKAGMHRAHELVSEISRQSDGIYLIMPFHKNTVELSAELIRTAVRK